MNNVKFDIDDILEMKKQHPCGCKQMKVLFVGSDIKLECCNCGHVFVTPRVKIEKNIKKVIIKQNI